MSLWNKALLGAIMLFAFSAQLFAYTVYPGDHYTVILAQSWEIDNNIRYRPHDINVVYDCTAQGCAHPDHVFVMLPSAGTTGASYHRILSTMAGLGIRSVGLNYHNDQQVYTLCGTRDSCYDEVRRAKALGTTGSTYVASKADGILERLVQALRRLGWNDMFDPVSGELLTEKLIVGGDGQGAGMAAWIGKNRVVARVCQFAGTWDHVSPAANVSPTLSNWVPASWLGQPSATPASRFYGFAYRNDLIDNGVDYLALNWARLGMGNRQQLSSYSTPASRMVVADVRWPSCEIDGASRHECAVNDRSTPLKADGTTPEFKDAWIHVCTHGLL